MLDITVSAQLRGFVVILNEILRLCILKIYEKHQKQYTTYSNIVIFAIRPPRLDHLLCLSFLSSFVFLCSFLWCKNCMKIGQCLGRKWQLRFPYIFYRIRT